LKEYSHGGVDAGYRTHVTRFPDQDFSVIVLSNLADVDVDLIAHTIVDLFLHDQFKEVATDPVMPKASESIVIEPSVLNTYLGNFELEPNKIITITEKYGQLFAKATGQSELNLVPISITEFDVPRLGVKLEFIPNGGDQVKLFRLYQDGDSIDVLRTTPFDPSGVVLTDYVGNYYSEELSTTYQISAEKNALIINHNRLGDVLIYPINRDVFSEESWLFEQVEFIRDEHSQIVGLRISNSRARNVYFGRME
jgi:hypothetical protein